MSLHSTALHRQGGKGMGLHTIYWWFSRVSGADETQDAGGQSPDGKGPPIQIRDCDQRAVHCPFGDFTKCSKSAAPEKQHCYAQPLLKINVDECVHVIRSICIADSWQWRTCLWLLVEELCLELCEVKESQVHCSIPEVPSAYSKLLC